MIYYFLLFEILVLLELVLQYRKVKNRRIVFLTVAFTCLAAMACLREYSVGTDTWQFVSNYKNLGPYGFSVLTDPTVDYEPGYLIYQAILYKINPNPRFLLIITYLFITFAFTYFIKRNCKDYFSATIIFIFSCQFLAAMCMLRQFTAISIMLLAFPLLQKKNKHFLIPYAGCVLLAACFHYFAILYLLFIPMVLVRRMNRTWWIVILSLFAPIYLFADKLALFLIRNIANYNDYIPYLEKMGESSGFRIGPFTIILIAMLIPYFLNLRHQYYNPRVTVWRGRDFAFVNIIISFLFFMTLLAGRFGLLTRVYYYFTPYMLLIPNLLDIKEDGNFRDSPWLFDYLLPKGKWRKYPGALAIHPPVDWKVFYMTACLGIFALAAITNAAGTYNAADFEFFFSAYLRY